jgi:protein-S-isoprenylcysteine O-methyltransferase Ste14
MGATEILKIRVTRVEESLMMKTFLEEYPEYRRRVKALIPGIL